MTLLRRTQRSWWTDRICEEFDAEVYAEQHLLENVLPFIEAMREGGIEYRVVKNTLFKLAAKDTDAEKKDDSAPGASDAVIYPVKGVIDSGRAKEIEDELREAGFEVVKMAGGLAGEPLVEDGDLIGVIARPLTVLT